MLFRKEEKFMKKAIAILLVAVMSLSVFTSCSFVEGFARSTLGDEAADDYANSVDDIKDGLHELGEDFGVWFSNLIFSFIDQGIDRNM